MKLFKREIICSPHDGSEYMRRYVIIECKWGGLYLQHFIAPDWSRDPHDHPRRFVSYILRGGYAEDVFTSDRQIRVTNFWRRGDVNNIEPTRMHRIAYIADNTWTLCLVGPRVRPWYFLTDKGFVNSRDYLGKDEI